jgi:tetratricopeptide (TPR) repeat protein
VHHREWTPTRIATLVAQLAPVSVALAIGIYQLAMPNVLFGIHGFTGNGYDDGVYLGAAIRFVNGTLPYRDFTFLQPPGIVLLFSPVALIGRLIGTRDALAIARCITLLVTSANVILIARVLRSRGQVAMVTGALTLACFPLAVAADHSLLLEPYLVFFCLLGIVLLFNEGSLASPRRIVAAGIAIGFAGAIKIWAIAIVIAALLVCMKRTKDAGRLALGITLGFALPCAAFFVASPASFIHDVVVAQLSRGTSGIAGLSIALRLGDIFGLSGIPNVIFYASLAVITALVFSAFVLCIFGLNYRRLMLLDIFFVLATVAVLAEMFSSPEFYDHYAYFPAAFLALLVGASAEHASNLLMRAARFLHAVKFRPVRLAAKSLPAVVAIVAAVLIIPESASFAHTYLADSTDPSSTIDQAIPQGACVISDDPIMLVASNRFAFSSSTCPNIIDPFGMWIAYDNGQPPPVTLPYPSDLVSLWQSAMDRAPYVLLSIPESNYLPWTPGLLHYFDQHFSLIASGPRTYVYRQNVLGSSPSSPAAAAANLLVTQGLAAEKAGNADLAFSDYRAATTKDPENVYAHYDLGYFYQVHGDASGASTEYRQALAIDPKFGDALYNMGVLETTKDPASAIEYYTRDLQVQPTSAAANFNLGVLLIKKGETTRGYSYLDTGIRLNPALGAKKPAGITLPTTTKS